MRCWCRSRSSSARPTWFPASSRTWRLRRPTPEGARGDRPPRPSARWSGSRRSGPGPRPAPGSPPSDVPRYLRETWRASDRWCCAFPRSAARPCLPPRFRWSENSSVDFSEYDILGSDYGHCVGQHMPTHHLVHRRDVRETRGAQVHPERLVGTVGNHVAAEFTFGCLDRGIGLAFGYAIALGEQFEVMDECFHVIFHFLARRRSNLVITGHYRTRVLAQPGDALLTDPHRLAHFLLAHQVAVVAVAVDAHRDVEIHFTVLRIGLLLAQVPCHTRAAQHRAGEAELAGALGRDHADADVALLPDAVVGDQRFVFIDPLALAGHEGLQVVQKRAFAPLVHALDV